MELGNQYTQLGDKDGELATGVGADNQEGRLVENGTEEIEIAEMVDEEGVGNQMMIITDTKPDGQVCTVMFLSFRTDRSGQTVQTQIRLLLVYSLQ